MTASGWAWLAAAGVLAVLDWVAVGRMARRYERIAKPLVLLGLIASVLSTPGTDVRGWLLAALGFGLVGDIALALERRPGLERRPASAPGSAPGSGLPANPCRTVVSTAGVVRTSPPPALADTAPGRDGTVFLLGLAAFLLGHLCYIAAMLAYRIDRLSVVFGLLLVLMALLSFGYRIIAGAHLRGGPALTVGVTLYMAALGSVVVLGVGTTQLWIAAGAALFGISDLMLGYDRFVQPRTWAPVAVIVTYHLAQALLVIGLVS